MQIYIYKNITQTGFLFLLILILCSIGYLQTAEEFFKRGKEHQSEREYVLAANAFGEAIKLKPDYAEAFFERGRTNQMSAGQDPYLAPRIDEPLVKSIFNDFHQAIYLSPNAANYYYHRGLNYYAAGECPKAIEDYTKAIALAPDQPEGYRVRFEAYRKQGDFTRALSDINKAIELETNALPLYFGRGELYLSKDDCSLMEKAIDDFSFIVDSNPNFPVVYEKRAEAYKKLADCSRKIADDYYQKADQEERKWSEVWGNFLNSRAKSLAQPIYPKDLIPLKLSGKVDVSVRVNGDGSVIKAELWRGDSRFKASAEAAALATKFSPTIIDGKPIETRGSLEFEFIPPIGINGTETVTGRGDGSGYGISGGAQTTFFANFITEKLEIRRYLPGDTKPLEKNKTYILGQSDLPTTNPARLFVAEKPLIEPNEVISPKVADTLLQLISMPKAIMTEEARKNGDQGTVRLRVTFQADGTIGNISVLSGLSDGLTKSAIAAAKRINFIPATKKGVPITVVKVIEYIFAIK